MATPRRLRTSINPMRVPQRLLIGHCCRWSAVAVILRMVALLFVGCGVQGWPPMPVQPTVWCDMGLEANGSSLSCSPNLGEPSCRIPLLYALNQVLEGKCRFHSSHRKAVGLFGGGPRCQ